MSVKLHPTNRAALHAARLTLATEARVERNFMLRDCAYDLAQGIEIYASEFGIDVETAWKELARAQLEAAGILKRS
jgi:hypothetical protein